MTYTRVKFLGYLLIVTGNDVEQNYVKQGPTVHGNTGGLEIALRSDKPGMERMQMCKLGHSR